MNIELRMIAYILARAFDERVGTPYDSLLAEAEQYATNCSLEDGGTDDVERLYKLYPTKCPIRGTSTGKCAKDKAKLRTLLTKIDPAKIEYTIKRYVAECKNGNVYIKNFSTFLNQFPDYDELDAEIARQKQPASSPPVSQKKSPEVIAIEAMHAGVKDASIVIHAIRCVWEGIPEEKVNSALRNAGYIR